MNDNVAQLAKHLETHRKAHGTHCPDGEILEVIRVFHLGYELYGAKCKVKRVIDGNEVEQMESLLWRRTAKGGWRRHRIPTRAYDV